MLDAFPAFARTDTSPSRPAGFLFVLGPIVKDRSPQGDCKYSAVRRYIIRQAADDGECHVLLL